MKTTCCPTCLKGTTARAAAKSAIGECPRCATARAEAARASFVALAEAALAARRSASLNASTL